MTTTPPRRVVTGHDAGGRSVVLSDGPIPTTLGLEDVNTAIREVEEAAVRARLVFDLT
jgi:hypothetical protein